MNFISFKIVTPGIYTPNKSQEFWGMKSTLSLSLLLLVVFALFGFFRFYGISTFVGYLMPNPIFIQMNSSISNNSF